MDVRAKAVVFNQRRTDLDLSIAELSAISGKRSSTFLSTVFAGQRDFDPADVEWLETILTELEEVQREHLPWRLSFKNALAVKVLLEERRAARRANQPKAFQVFINSITGLRGYFAGQSEGKPLAELFSGRAKFLTSEVADELVAKLVALGVSGARKVVAQPTDAVVHETLASVWEEVSNDEPNSTR